MRGIPKWIKKIEIKPEESALLVIDMQNDMIHEKGKIALARAGFSNVARGIINPIKRLIKVLHELRIPVIYVVHIHRPDYNDAGPISIARELEASKQGSWGAEIVDELKPSDVDYIVIKKRHSAFYSTDLELLLRGLKVKTLILTGVATNACVESTARDSQFRDFNTIVLNDCTASFSKEEHEASLKNIQNFYGYVTTSEEATRILYARGKCS